MSSCNVNMYSVTVLPVLDSFVGARALFPIPADDLASAFKRDFIKILQCGA